MSREEIINLYTLHKRSKTNKKLTTPDLQKKKRCGLSIVALVMHAAACSPGTKKHTKCHVSMEMSP